MYAVMVVAWFWPVGESGARDGAAHPTRIAARCRVHAVEPGRRRAVRDADEEKEVALANGDLAAAAKGHVLTTPRHTWSRAAKAAVHGATAHKELPAHTNKAVSYTHLTLPTKRIV